MILKLRNRIPEILVYPNKKLQRIAEEVDFEKTSLKKRTDIIRKMGAALGNSKYGMQLGIAAPQIGINKRIIIVRGNVMFNPSWNPSHQTKDMVEACYSLPGKFYKTTRAKYGWAKWTDINGKPCESKLHELPAIVFQHEFDHLNGTCCHELGEECEEPSRAPLI